MTAASGKSPSFRLRAKSLHCGIAQIPSAKRNNHTVLRKHPSVKRSDHTVLRKHSSVERTPVWYRERTLREVEENTEAVDR
jgi:hypothetical protein